jgi:signal transduction histidine kinase/DNA-binding NarL/FixJ family response regulator
MNNLNQESGKQILTDSTLIRPSLNILLVEDNPGDVEIIKDYIRASEIEFTLTHVSTLRETLLNCIDHVYDVILLDLGLPDSEGMEALKKLHIFKVVPPIIVMTGLDDEDFALSALREGAQDYLVKSRMSPDKILKSIQYGIERKKLQNLQEKIAHQFSILSKTTTALNECEDISMMYTVICDSINLLLDNTNAISIEYIHRMAFRATNFGWLEPWIARVNKLLGIDLNDHVFRLEEQYRDFLDIFSDGTLKEIKGGLYELFAGIVSKSDCMELEKAVGINYLYTIGFFRNKNFYGGSIIIAPARIGGDDIKIIETLCSQASLSIYRRLIEKNLRLSEMRVRRLNEELEQKVRERTEDLESANLKLTRELRERNLAEEALKKSEAKLIELNATKDKFFNIVAHDMKNPFTSLLGSTELLYENIEKMGIDNIRTLAQVLNDSAKSGYAILLNLLDWSRSQTGLIKFNPERINLKKLIDDNIEDMKLYITNKSISVTTEVNDDIFIFADENMTNTVLRNLLSNAVKFTHRNGSIIFRVKVTDSEVIISVKDNGVGISSENIGQLFRIDTKYSMPGTEKEQGTGLGLKLSKEFVEKMNGRIWVESIENKGSEFFFSIPSFEKFSKKT